MKIKKTILISAFLFVGFFGFFSLSEAACPWTGAEVQCEANKALARGAKCQRVCDLQDKLNIVTNEISEYSTAGDFRIEPDGIYGAKTFSAVEEAQRVKRLEVDGIAGTKTLEALGLPVPTANALECAIDSDCPTGKRCDEISFSCVASGTGGGVGAGTGAGSGVGAGGVGGSTGKAFCDTAKFVYENGLCLPKNSFGRNSIAGSDSLPDLVAKILKALLTFAGVIVVVAIVYGGYLYIAAAGNEEQAEKGKAALINSTIGLVIVMLAYALVNILVTLISK